MDTMVAQKTSPKALSRLNFQVEDSEKFGLDDRFHEITQLHLALSIHGMRPFRASHMIRTLEALD